MRLLLTALLTLSVQVLSVSAIAKSNLENYKSTQLTFNGDSKADCNLLESTRTYKCLHNNVTIYVALEGHMSAIAINADKSMIPLEINNIKAGKVAIYNQAKMPSIPDFLLEKSSNTSEPQPSVNYVQKMYAKISELDSFIKTLENAIPAVAANQEILSQLRPIYSKMQEEFNSTLKSPDLKIEQDDGTVRTCQKIAPEKATCEVYNCSGPKANETTLLFYNPMGMDAIPPVLQTFENDTLKKYSEIKTISNPSSGKLISTYNNTETKKSHKQLEQVLHPSLKNDIANVVFLKNQFSEEYYNYLESSCTPHPIMDKYKRARNNLREKLSNLELKELIYMLEDGTILADFHSIETARSQGCYYNGVYFNSEAEKHLDKIATAFPKDVMPQDVISMAKVNELFKSATQMKDIAWNYKYDGCYARAHLMARRFEAQGIRVDKAWLKGNLYVPGTDITWNYHVAPLLYVKNAKGEIQKMVIDPSLFDKPVTLEEWDQKMAKKTVKGSIRTAFPFPQNADFYERSALAISSSDPYTPAGNIHTTEEEIMESAANVMAEYLLDSGEVPY